MTLSKVFDIYLKRKFFYYRNKKHLFFFEK